MKELKEKGVHTKNINISKSLLFIILIFLFLFNIIKFFNTNGSEIPIISILFNMIIIIGLIIFFLHEEEITSENKNIQMTLDKYFKGGKSNGQKKQ